MQYAIAHYRTAADKPLKHHVETATDQATALQAVLLLVPIDQVVSITLGSEIEVPVVKATRAVEMAGAMYTAVEQASAALPDAWKAVDCKVPVDLIHALQDQLKACREAGLSPEPRAPKPQPVTWTIIGGDGDFDVCAVTGQVLTPKDQMPESYRMYTAVDVEEYRGWLVSHGVDQPNSVNICAVRLYDADGGSWEPAEDDYRQDLLKTWGLA